MIILSQSHFDLLQFYYDYFTKSEKVKEIKIKRDKKKNDLRIMLSEEKIDDLTEEGVIQAYTTMWTAGRRWAGELIKSNDLNKIRSTLKYLLYNKSDDIFTRYEKVLTDSKFKLKELGNARISELVNSVRPDLNVLLVNNKIVHLVDRLNLELEFGKSPVEKSKVYNQVAKEIQNKFNLESSYEVDFFTYFIKNFSTNDFYPNVKEPLGKIRTEFAFIDKDFLASSTGEKEDAKYLHNRLKDLCNVLVKTLPNQFLNYKNYVSAANKRPKKRIAQWKETQWMGFVAPEYVFEREQESIQLQVSINKLSIVSEIRISFVGKKKMLEAKNIIENNKEEFLKIMHGLPSDYFVAVKIRKTNEEQKFPASQITSHELVLILAFMVKKNAEFSIGHEWDKKKAVESGTKITQEIVNTFENLLSAYQFINGSKIVPNQTKPSSDKGDYEEEDILDNVSIDNYSRALKCKPNLILYGPPGTGKT